MNAATPKSLLVLSGLTGLVAALLVGTGEYLLQFTADGNYSGAHYAWMADIPQARLRAGHYLAILSAPLYLIGYWHIGQMLKPAGVKTARLVSLLGGYGFMVGAVWIGQRAFLALTAAAVVNGTAQPGLLDNMAALNEPLVNVLRVAMVVVSLIWIVQILRGRSHYPRLMALFSPLALLIAIFAFLPGNRDLANIRCPRL